MESEDQIEEDEQVLYEQHRIVTDPGQQPLRIDKFLNDKLSSLSRNRIQQVVKAGLVTVNGQPVKSNYKIRAAEEIKVFLPNEKREFELLAEDIPLDIVAENDHWVLINKPSGLVVHPGFGNFSGTLVNALLFHFGQLPDKGDFEEPRPGLVHRLDKDTTGVMVVAKSEIAHTHLAKQFFDRTIERRYHALVWGDLPDEGTIEGNIGRSLKNRKVMQIFPEGDFGKHAVTHYKVVERLGYVTLIECKLETGRTHQIRAHFQYIGHPLFGDITYGGDKILKGTTFTKYKQFVQNCFKVLPRQALHARSLGFEDPISGDSVFHEVPYPSDLEDVLDKWRNYALHAKK